MTYLRIIHDNAADRATVTANTTASADTPASNLKTDVKAQMHRSTGTTAIYTLTWPTVETVGAVVLPATNLTAASQIRVEVFADADVLLHDTGLLWAAPGPPLGLWDWTLPLNANAFAFGGATKSHVWLPDHYPARKVVITVTDPDNAAGYIDNSRLVVGGFWQPKVGASLGASVGVQDMSTAERNENGSEVPQRSTLYDTLAINLDTLRPTDRLRMDMIIRSVGTTRCIQVSPVAGMATDVDPTLEQAWSVYGRRDNSTLNYRAFRIHSSQLNIRGW